jgi:ribosomal-protein-alanine N-acetyltransferase
MLGHIGYFRAIFYSDALEIGYQLFDVSDRRKGLMTEVLRLFCSFLFSYLPVYRLQLAVQIGHVASRRVAEKVGFRLEGILRGFVFQRGAHHDVEILSLLRGEMEPVAPFTPLPGGH